MIPTLARPQVAGCRMISSFVIKNFRSFGDVKVDDCRRVNVLVGDNGSGKTALLEALFLGAGVSPEIVLRTRSWRGFSAGAMSGSNEMLHEALWADLFHNFQTGQQVLISLRGDAEKTRSVTVRLNKRGAVRVLPAISPGKKSRGAPVRVIPETSPVEFKWKIQGYPDVSVKPTFDGEKLVVPPVPDSYVKAAFFAANQTASGLESANRFSQLSRTFQADDFIDKFNLLFPTIKDISVELTAQAAMLFARVEGLPQKIPLSLASGGMSKLAGILLAMTEQAGGVVIVDEIENGFYYKRLPMIWQALLDFSRTCDCQVFASTHSQEALRALAPIVERNPDDFCFMRTVLQSDGSMVRRFDGERMANAILDNVEVR